VDGESIAKNDTPTQPATVNRPPAATPSPRTATPAPSRGWDIDLPRGGGGALDPFAVGSLIAFGLAAAGTRKRSR